MGARNVRLFGDYFPIRFDYLDTMQGGELSLQVHPPQEYAESQFNEHMTRQESYYIMRNAPGAKVYLGLKEGISGERSLRQWKTPSFGKSRLSSPTTLTSTTRKQGIST